MALRIAIYIYDDAEVLDIAGPFEVLTTASRVHARQHPQEPPLFSVCLVADAMRLVPARGRFTLQPHYTIHDHPSLDVLVVPGGVHSGEMQRPEISAWIRQVARQAQLTASVCTGAFLLASAGLLDGLQVTTHWEDQQDLQQLFPQLEVLPQRRWVDQGRVVTSAGIAAGIEMSLHLVRRFAGLELAQRTARQIEFPWSPE